MLSVELSSCCSCDVFRQYFAVKRIKCSATVPPFCSNYQNKTTTQPRPQVFSFNISIICNQAALLMSFWRHRFNTTKFIPNLVNSSWFMVNYASVFSQSGTGKYFEWIIRTIIPCSPNMVTVRVCSKLKTSWKSVVFTNKVGKNSRYFVVVFNKAIIALALLWNEMIIANSYPTRTRGVIVK